MNNLSVSLNHSGIGGSLGGNLINHLCYADDLYLIALSSSGMQYLLDICDKYATGHQLTYNATKSFTLCFKPKHIKICIPDFVLGKLVIPAVDKCKYLGIIISEANCDGDLKRQMRKYYANANMLLRKFSYCSPDVKCCMIKSYCATMYCSSMWFDSTVTSMKKLKIAYNNGLRRLLNLPKYIGYEPADITVHPPPPKRSRVGSFFSHRCLVPPKFFPQRKSGFCRRYSH